MGTEPLQSPACCTQSGTTLILNLPNLTKMLIMTILGCVLANEGLAHPGPGLAHPGPGHQHTKTLPLMGCLTDIGCQTVWKKNRHCKGIALEEECMNLTICDRGPNPVDTTGQPAGGGPPSAVCNDNKACTNDDDCMVLEGTGSWYGFEAVRKCQDYVNTCLWDGEIRFKKGYGIMD